VLSLVRGKTTIQFRMTELLEVLRPEVIVKDLPGMENASVPVKRAEPDPPQRAHRDEADCDYAATQGRPSNGGDQ
jgi:hypothetical protein